jgi:hypothetical protein
MNEITYKIDGVDLADLGINIESSAGVIDKLSMKGVVKTSHPSEHGEDVDLSEHRYNSRKVALGCWMLAEDNADMIRKQDQIAHLIGKSRLIRLEIFPERFSPLVFDVYCESGIAFNKEWDEDGEQLVAEFTLNLIEPQPVKKVFVTYSATIPVVEIASDHPIQISWGDGVVEKYCFNGVWGHPYTDDLQKHYVIISGVLSKAIITTNMQCVCCVLL